MLNFNLGSTTEFDTINSMLLTTQEKNAELEIRVFEKNKISLKEKSEIENPDEFICKISGKNDHFKVELKDKLPNNITEKLICSLKMSGMIDLKFSYIKSTEPFKHDQTVRLSNSPEFMNLMKKWFESKVYVPDTNLLINHTVSGIEFASDPDLFKSIEIAIPRLVVLELENQSNKNKLSDDSCSLDEKKKTLSENKRKIFLAFSELVYLQKKDNVSLFPLLPPQLLAQFPTIASGHNADSWIRHEIQNYVANKIQERLSKGGSGLALPRQFVLVTSDLVNSLAASSEGTDSIYVSEFRDKNDSRKILEGSLKQVTQVLVILSILLETIDLSINSTLYRFQGFWSGITNYDIINYRIKTSGLTQ